MLHKEEVRPVHGPYSALHNSSTASSTTRRRHAMDVTVKDAEGEHSKLIRMKPAHNELVYLRGVISSLYILLTQLHDHQGPQTQKAIVAEMYARQISELILMAN